MKTKVILLFTVVIATGGVAVLWWKFAPAPGPVMISGLAGNAVSASSQNPEMSAVEPVPLSQLSSVSSPASPPAAGEIRAQMLAKTMAALTSTNLETREFGLTNLLPALVLQDPAAAAHLAEAITDADQREAAMRRVAQLWAVQDPSSAQAWASGLTEPFDRDATLTDVCLQMAQTDPASAVQARDQFVPDNVPNLALAGLTQQWGEKDLSAALAWTLARPQSGQRDELIARLAFVESRTDPAAAANLLVDQIPPGETQNEAAMSVLHQWALRDPAAAGAWIEQFPDGPLRERAVLELAGIINTFYQAHAR